MASNQTGTGKVVIVTGANTGLGFEASKLFAQDGWEVILACRNEEKAQTAIEQIKKQFPDCNLTFMKLDLSSCASVRKFATEFTKTGRNLNVLVNNAGIGLASGETKRTITDDGFELTMASNHFGHFLLTNLLLDCLKSTSAKDGEARVIVLGSSVHDLEMSNMMARRSGVKDCEPLDLDDLQMEKPGVFNGVQSYRNSKTVNIMFTYELARKLEGSGVIANCLCPGFIPSTELIRNANAGAKFFLKYIMDGLFKYIGKKSTRTIGEGAADIVWLATSDEAKCYTGKYFCNGKHEPAESKDETTDLDMQKRLWELSEQAVSDKGL